MRSVTARDVVLTPPTFSLKGLFAFLTVVAVLVAPVHWFGGEYLFSAGLSLALVACCVATYGIEKRSSALAAAIVGGMVAFVLAMVAMIFFLHAFLNVLLCVVLVAFKPSRRVFALATVALMIGLYGFVFAQGAAKLRELQAAKDRFPFVSLAERLSFEREPSNVETSPAALTRDVDGRLVDQDDRQESRFNRRVWALRELHENTYRHFARAAGFGVGRMRTLRAEMVDLKPREPLTLPWQIPVAAADPAPTDLYAVHDSVTTSFLSADRIGYVRSREAVAGFESHGLDVNDGDWTHGPQSGEKWQVVRLELVSILRHEEPCVYIADTLPAMDQLADVPHRALDEFESGALPKLDTEKDVVLTVEERRIRMLGALRAGNTCLECHTGSRGRLLGAFSYEVVPAAAAKQIASSGR
jgi:hypothetical protein